MTRFLTNTSAPGTFASALAAWSARLAGFLAVFAILALGAPETFAQGKRAVEDTPEGVVRALYQTYIEAPPGKDFGFDYNNQKAASRYFDPALTRLLVVDGRRAEPKLDFDPFVDGQDFDIEKVEYETKSVSDKEAEVTARFENLGEKKTVVYTLTKTPKGWRISDLHRGGSTETLRDILNRLPQ